MGFALAAHFLAVAVWVGGMFFAYMALRPAAARLLDPPQRLTLWQGVFERFFGWVWVSVILLVASGSLMFFGPFGGWQLAPLHLKIMFGSGSSMLLIFFHVYFAVYPRLKRSAVAGDWPSAAKALAQLRVSIGINLSIGLFTICIATLGEYLN